MTQTYAEQAREAARVLAEKTGVERHDIALVMGSGWLPAVDALGDAVAEISTTDLPGFAAPAVAGH
ncbi:MAG: punA, partial [Marmoricola sp.]|nr:punA [Marmoricola sp.]